VIINGDKFLSEPTWEAGSPDNLDKSSKKYRPALFLRPLVCGLNDHFPCDGSEKLLDFPFSYDEFKKIPSYESAERKL
jgi:hypothetical protein